MAKKTKTKKKKSKKVLTKSSDFYVDKDGNTWLSEMHYLVEHSYFDDDKSIRSSINDVVASLSCSGDKIVVLALTLISERLKKETERNSKAIYALSKALGFVEE